MTAKRHRPPRQIPIQPSVAPTPDPQSIHRATWKSITPINNVEEKLREKGKSSFPSPSSNASPTRLSNPAEPSHPVYAGLSLSLLPLLLLHQNPSFPNPIRRVPPISTGDFEVRLHTQFIPARLYVLIIFRWTLRWFFWVKNFGDLGGIKVLLDLFALTVFWLWIV